MAEVQAPPAAMPQAPPPPPGRPHTRDDNDPVVIRKRASVLKWRRKWRAEDPEGFLAAKREYNSRHAEQRRLYNLEYRARKRAEQLAQVPPDNVITVNLLEMLADMMGLRAPPRTPLPT